MSLVDSNTYIEPTAGTTLDRARGQFNNTLRSLLTNFRSSAPMAPANLTASGAPFAVPDGTLFHFANSNVNTLLIQDSTSVQQTHFTQSFTRVGIGARREDGIVSLMSNVTHYELGELATTATKSGGASLIANARLYLNKGVTGTTADFIDVGIPPTNGSVVNTMIAVGGITSDRFNLAWNDYTSSPENRQNAHLRVGTTGADSNTSILLGSQNVVSNVSLVKLHGGIGTHAGLHVFHGSDNSMSFKPGYAPIAANLICQAYGTTADGNETGQSIAPLVPVGTIVAWSTSTIPDGWLRCDGRSVSRTTYADLFNTLDQAVWGVGDGSTTFDLPNFLDRTLYGAQDSGTNQELGDTSATSMGSIGGVNTNTSFTGVTGVVTTVSVSAKDAGGASVVGAVIDASHSHVVSLPQTRVHWIIKI